MGAYVDEADYMALTDGSQPYDGQRILQAEDEVNGLMTYDRRVVKLDADTMLPISRALQDAMEKTVASFEKMG